jgi:hypothetical protein
MVCTHFDTSSHVFCADSAGVSLRLYLLSRVLLPHFLVLLLMLRMGLLSIKIVIFLRLLMLL